MSFQWVLHLLHIRGRSQFFECSLDLFEFYIHVCLHIGQSETDSVSTGFEPGTEQI